MHKKQNKVGIRCLVAMLSGAMVLTSYAAPRVIASSYQTVVLYVATRAASGNVLISS